MRKGGVRSNPREGTLKSRIGEDFGVAKARALYSVASSMPNFQLVSNDVRVKPSKGVSQSQHKN